MPEHVVDDDDDDQSALAAGNLQFPISVVQQMIRCDVSFLFIYLQYVVEARCGMDRFLTLCDLQFRMYDFDSNGTMSFEGVFVYFNSVMLFYL